MALKSDNVPNFIKTDRKERDNFNINEGKKQAISFEQVKNEEFGYSKGYYL